MNHFQNYREKIYIGSFWKCNRRMVDAEKYYTHLLDDVDLKLLKLRESVHKTNAGVCFVSFRYKDIVSEILEDFSLI